MALINVRRDVTDAFYRYKMERLQTKIEGKGNGIKTVIVNLSSVAQSLARPGNYLIKYFGFELGAQTNLDPADDRWIINGAHEASKLQDHLDGFINKFVLCKKCKNPETDVVIKDGRILLDCKACGQRTEVDLRLKLSGFILKNQPKKGKKDKAERRAAKKAKQQALQNGQNGDAKEENGDGGSPENGSDNGSGSGEAEAEPVSDDEFEKMKAHADTIAATVVDDEAKEHTWAVDMSEEAIKARQAQLPGEFKQKLSFGGDDDEDGEGGSSVYDELGNWIHEQGVEQGIDSVPAIEIYKKAKDLGIESKSKTCAVLVQALFTPDKILSQIPKRAPLLKQFVTSERHEKYLLGGTERFIGLNSKENPDLYKQVVKILHLYYNSDLVSEEVVTKWGTHKSGKFVDVSTSKKVRKAAEPFIKWLEEADEESDSDDE